MSTPEGEVKKLIDAMLLKYKIYSAAKAGAFSDDACGWYYKPVQHAGVSGVPDYIGHFYGYFFSIEAKAPGKTPTGFQALQIDAIETSGAAAFIVDGAESLVGVERWFEYIQLILTKIKGA